MRKRARPKGPFHVYIVECSNRTYYTGYTNDLEKRLATHESGRGAKYLRGRGPVKLVYSRKYRSLGAALSAERGIKALTRKGKEELVNARRKEKKHACRQHKEGVRELA